MRVGMLCTGLGRAELGILDNVTKRVRAVEDWAKLPIVRYLNIHTDWREETT